MTVKEFIAYLQTLDQDKRLVIGGYEAGVDDVEGVNVTRILLNRNTQWYYGKHEEVYFEDGYDEEAYVIR